MTAGKIYFAKVIMTDEDNIGMPVPSKMYFDLDELYIDEGA